MVTVVYITIAMTVCHSHSIIFFAQYLNALKALYATYLPLPLVHLTAPDGTQGVHIAPEAFEVASAEFKDEVEFWQNALPGKLKGQLASVSKLWCSK